MGALQRRAVRFLVECDHLWRKGKGKREMKRGEVLIVGIAGIQGRHNRKRYSIIVKFDERE